MKVPTLSHKRANSEVPAVFHRFSKDSVHLRSMYKQLYPTTKNSESDSDPGSIERLNILKPDLVKLGKKNLNTLTTSNSKKSAFDPD